MICQLGDCFKANITHNPVRQSIHDSRDVIQRLENIIRQTSLRHLVSQEVFWATALEQSDKRKDDTEYCV